VLEEDRLRGPEAGVVVVGGEDAVPVPLAIAQIERGEVYLSSNRTKTECFNTIDTCYLAEYNSKRKE